MSRSLVKKPYENDYVNRVPEEGDDILIPCEWTVIIYGGTFKFNSLTIEGRLIFND